MRPQSCKAKGRRLQQVIASDLLELYPHLTEDDVKSTSMGAGGEDVQLSAVARRSIPYSFEAKNQERLNVWGAVHQARANRPESTDPVVVMKRNKEHPHVVITWDLFKRLIKRPGDGDIAAHTPKRRLLRLADELQKVAASMEDAHTAE